MKEQLIALDTAKLAKEKGFTFHMCDFDWKQIELFPKGDRANHVLPTQSLLQKWLREVHNLFVWIFPENNGETFGWEIDEAFKDKYKELPEGDYDLTEYNYKTYEEALEKGLQEALKLI